MADSLNQILFDDKTFSDLLKEIHGNQKKKAKQLASLIAELRPLVQSLGDATVVVPLIKEYMEISVKNDDALIKMAAIVQRLSTSTANTGDGGLLTDEEMTQLMDVAEEIAKTVEEPNKPKQIEQPKDGKSGQ
tara:strand:+ start:1347 stop:1745 length:399 start_codon:yes stop_codon:yes gene_type:complete